jgi:transcription initiation factor IIE alpha subunit
MTKKKVAQCPSCSTKVTIDPQSRPSQQVVCPLCDSILEIIKLDPPLLDFTFDYDDYFDGGYYLYEEISPERRY